MDQPAPSAPLMNDHPAARDLLDFSPYTETLLEIIRDPQTKGPLVVGLFGTWGSGKTSLMQFVQTDLEDVKKNAGRTFRCIWFDAWKYEKEEALGRALGIWKIDRGPHLPEKQEEDTG